MVIAELALQKLEPGLQRRLEQQAFSLVRQQSSEKRLYLMRAFPGTSAFAQMAVFADDHREVSLAGLYTRYAESLPEEFLAQADENTATWHYRNRAFYSSGLDESEVTECRSDTGSDVAWAIERLRALLAESGGSEENRILTLALLVHFVGDAHQPLHGMSRIGRNCESDQGGSRFCFRYTPNSFACETNLHSFWDSALDFFVGFASVEEAVEFVQRVAVLPRQARDLNPETWLSEGYRLARFVYSIEEGSGGDRFYISEGQVIAYERMALAAERLALILAQVH